MSGPRAWQGPNLARQPFLNQRPIERLALLLWLLALGVGAFATWRFRSIEQDLGSKNADLARFTEEAASARDRAAALQSALERADLAALNLRTEFLNRRIAERAFSWNRLFDRLTEAMPRGVRLRTLTPQAFAKEVPRRTGVNATTAAQTRVALSIDGQAEDTEALLELVDRLFAHPAFDRPNLVREAEKKDLLIDFDLTVDFLPQAGAAQTEAPVAVEPSAGGPRTAFGGEAAIPGAVAPSSGAPVAAAASVTATAGREPGAAPSGGGAAAARPATAGRAPVPASRGALPGAPSTAPPAEESMLGAAEARPASGAAAARGPAAAAPAGAAPGTRPYPYNLVPTPLKPYASSAGGDR